MQTANNSLKSNFNNYSGEDKFTQELLNMLPAYFLHGGVLTTRNTPVFFKDNDIVGYGIRNGIVYIPVDRPISLEHEIAHFVEIPIRRVTKDDFGIANLGKIVNNMPKYVGFTGIARENRVRTIENILVGYNGRSKSRVESNKAWEEAVGDFKNSKFKFTNMNQVYDWERQIINSTLRTWNKERIHFEFKLRANYIKEFIETNKSKRETIFA